MAISVGNRNHENAIRQRVLPETLHTHNECINSYGIAIIVFTKHT